MARPRKRRFSEEPFGPTIERLMDETGVTYRGLAAKTSLSAGYLNHLVHGNRPVPSNDVIERLAGALGVEAEHFVDCVRTGREPITGGEAGLRVVRILEAAAESLARRGQVVEV